MIGSGNAVLEIRAAALTLGGRQLWSDLSLAVAPGEFVAVLGANGSGKTSLLRSILGQQSLDAGDILVAGRALRHGDRRVGYIPQQRLASHGVALRGRDLVMLGANGHRFGLPYPSSEDKRRVSAALGSVRAEPFADSPLGELSGGEQQRLRVAQALVADPVLLLCDEPLASLDLQHQRGIAELIDEKRRERNAAVLFVTHDINPVLGMVDRILYLASGRFRVGAPGEVLTSAALTELYGTPVDVIRSRGRIFVAGVPDAGDDVHHLEQRV